MAVVENWKAESRALSALFKRLNETVVDFCYSDVSRSDRVEVLTYLSAAGVSRLSIFLV